MPHDEPARRRGGIRPLLIIPIALIAALVGFLIANSRTTTSPDNGAEPIAKSAVTRAAGDSVIKSDDGSGSVNLRSCPGPPNAGQTTGCDIIDQLPDGTVVTMECWIDANPAPGHPDNARRWFIVTPRQGAPHPGRRGYVFSDEIPVEQQVRTPKCSNDLTNKLLNEPEPTSSVSTAPTPSESRSASSTTTPPPSTTTSPPPPPSTTPPMPVLPRVTVQNLVTNGATEMREDTRHPAYLSTRTVKSCKDQQPHCNVPGDLATGDQLTALCQTTGDTITNGERNNSIDDNNPGLAESSLWYRLKTTDGRTGYLSEIWLAKADRGGLDLPSC